MLFLKRVNNSYHEPDSVEAVINYILRNSGNNGAYIGGVNILDLGNAADEFVFIKSLFKKRTGVQIKHFIASFDPKDLFVGPQAVDFAYRVCAYYAPRFQIVFSVHTNTKFMHVHFVVNSVSFVDGAKLHENKAELLNFERYCRSVYEQTRHDYDWARKKLHMF